MTMLAAVASAVAVVTRQMSYMFERREGRRVCLLTGSSLDLVDEASWLQMIDELTSDQFWWRTRQQGSMSL